MLERVRNVLKIARKRGASMPQTTEEKPRPKKNKMNERYPILDPLIVDNEESMAAHEAAIEAELTKKKPKDTTLIHLMKSTYFSRRPYILEEAISVSQILEKYPALNRPAIVSCKSCPLSRLCIVEPGAKMISETGAYLFLKSLYMMTCM